MDKEYFLSNRRKRYTRHEGICVERFKMGKSVLENAAGESVLGDAVEMDFGDFSGNKRRYELMM